MGLKRFAAGVVKEGKRVRWPKRDVLIPSIVVVIVIAVFSGIIFGHNFFSVQKNN